jgi:hypothetical protein
MAITGCTGVWKAFKPIEFPNNRLDLNMPGGGLPPFQAGNKASRLKWAGLLGPNPRLQEAIFIHCRFL